MGRFTFALVIRAPKTARICSQRMATSRPRFSPASVTTEKLGERTSTHCGSPAKTAGPLAKTKARMAGSRRSAELPRHKRELIGHPRSIADILHHFEFKSIAKTLTRHQAA